MHMNVVQVSKYGYMINILTIEINRVFVSPGGRVFKLTLFIAR